MIDLFNKKKLKETENERDYYERVCETKNKTINNLEKDKSELNKTNNNLIQENKKLIEWIEKIINEVGIKTNDSYIGQTINIPYCEKIKPYKAYEKGWIPEQERKDVIIPSIRFTKFRYKEESNE